MFVKKPKLKSKMRVWPLKSCPGLLPDLSSCKPQQGCKASKMSLKCERPAEMRSLQCPAIRRGFPTEAQEVYYSEVQSLLSEVLEKAGAKVERVMVFDHTIRSSTASGLNTLGVRGKWAGPATFVHADYNERSAPQRLQQLAQTPGYTGVLLPAEDVQKVLSSGQRFAFINVWRSIDPLNPAFDYPLSLCDPRSVEEEDWMNYEMVYPDRVGSRLSLSNRAAASHKWYYYPEMRIDECLIFSCYDRRPDVPRFVFHSAFDDPSARTKIPRQSIEARTAVIFDELALKSTI
ncbi:unnamed protein product [Durusdinium trenchii]|uniref:Methyltransferase n=1 Tax=Durusdinium trenchii TaxID=1381693 RepID=A0ABP0QLB8_9DINO